MRLLEIDEMRWILYSFVRQYRPRQEERNETASKGQITSRGVSYRGLRWVRGAIADR